MKNKTIAAVLAFTFGIFGVHRFYLGQTGRGMLYALFFWTGIPALIGLIDAILFLAMDNDEFDHKYNWRYIDPQYRRLDTDYDRRLYEQRRRGQERTRRVREREFDRVYGREETQPPVKKAPPPPTRSQPKRNPYKESGIKKFKEYDYDGAIEDFEKALEVNDKDIAIHFNLACAYSITENKEEAFYHLEKAIENGFSDTKKIQDHDALAYVRIQAEYQDFVKNGYRMSQEIEDFEKKQKESSNLLDQLKKLGELREKGLLTEEEFTAQKQKLLG